MIPKNRWERIWHFCRIWVQAWENEKKRSWGAEMTNKWTVSCLELFLPRRSESKEKEKVLMKGSNGNGRKRESFGYSNGRPNDLWAKQNHTEARKAKKIQKTLRKVKQKNAIEKREREISVINIDKILECANNFNLCWACGCPSQYRSQATFHRSLFTFCLSYTPFCFSLPGFR